jgi:hypothetical protein
VPRKMTHVHASRGFQGIINTRYDPKPTP